MTFLLTLCPTVWFGDSGELIAAADCLGVAHPPGYPLWTALAKLFLFLPWGEPAFRVNLFSAVSAALACALAARMVGVATSSRLGAMAAGSFLAVSSTFWSAAVVTEVYAFHVLLGLWLLRSCQRLGRGEGSGALFWASLATGLGLAHHPTIVLWFPAAAWLAFRRRGEKGPVWALPDSPTRIALAALGAVALAGGFYGWMLVRSGSGPPSNWGSPSTFPALWDHVTAASYRQLDLGWSAIVRLPGWRRVLETAFLDLAGVGTVMAAIGMTGSLRRGSDPVLTQALLLLAGASVIFGLRYSVDDPEMFLLPALMAVALWAGMGIVRIAAWKRGGTRAAVALSAVVVVASWAHHGTSRNLHGVTAGLDYAEDVLGGVPPGGTLFVESDDAFPVLYATQVLGRRPDIEIYHRRGLLFRDLSQEVAPPAGAPPDWSRDRIRVEMAFLGRELLRNEGRNFWFLGWPGYEPPPELRMEPVGLLWRLSRASSPEAAPESARAYRHETSVRLAAERWGGGVARSYAATYPLSRGERALFEDDLARGEAELEEAIRVAGDGSAIPNYVGTVWARNGYLHRAVRAFRIAVESNPASVASWNNLARALDLLGDREGANEALRRSRALTPQTNAEGRSFRGKGEAP